MSLISKKSLLLSAALCMSIICSIYLWTDQKIEEQYYCSESNEMVINTAEKPVVIKQDFKAQTTNLYRLELKLLNAISESSSLKCTINHGPRIIYESNVLPEQLKPDEWYGLYTNIPLEINDIYEITIIIEDSNEINDNIFSIRYGYLGSPNILDKILKVSSLYILFLIGIFIVYKWNGIDNLIKILINKYAQLKLKKADWIFPVLEVLLCYIIIEDSKIEFQVVIKAILVFLSLIAGFYHNQIIKFFKQVKEKNILLPYVLLVLFASFSIVGNRLFIYPLNVKTNLLDMALYIITAIWIAPIVALLITAFNKIALFPAQEKSKVFVIITGFLLIVPAFFALYAYNPAISSIDTLSCMNAAHNLRGMINWHPPFYCMLLKLIIFIWDSPYAVVITQFIFWVFVVEKILLFARKRGIHEGLLITLAFLMGINPANYIHLCTIWKDIPYGISLMWMTLIIAKLVLDEDAVKHHTIYLEFIVSSVFLFFIRQNGMIVYFLICLFMMVFLFKNKKMLISIVASLILIFLIKYPIYSYLDIQEAERGGAYIGLGQDILGVYYNGGDVSEDTMEIVNILTGKNIGQFNYDPYYATSSYDLDIPLSNFIKDYLITFIYNPLLMTKEIICRQDSVWDIFGGENTFIRLTNFIETLDEIDEWTVYYPKRIINEYTEKFNAFNTVFLNNQFMMIISWKTGIYTLFTCFGIFLLLFRKVKNIYFLIFIPFIGQIISLMLSTGWADFRYYWPLNLTGICLGIILPTIKEKN